jgi:hypothetical protein
VVVAAVVNKPGFVVPVYRDQCFAVGVLRQIRTHYPIAPILVIADGIHIPGFQEFVEGLGGIYHLGDRLKPQQFGCSWSIRLLELMQQHLDGDLWIKIDADAAVYRPIDFTPLTQPFDLAGNIHTTRNFGSNFQYVRAACRLYHPPVVAKLLASQLLLNPKYTHEPRWGYLRFANRFKLPGDPPGEVFEALHCEGLCLGDVGAQLGLKLVEVPDICIKFREPVPADAPLNYSVVHPVR